MKASTAIALMLLLLVSVRADLEIAQSFDDVARFLEINNAALDNTNPNAYDESEDDTVGLLFIDSTLNDQSGQGFLSGVVSSVTHIFSGAGDNTNSQQSIASIEKEISDETRLMQIDVSNENLKGIQESYDVTNVPYLIIFKRGIVVLKEVPNQNTHDKILQILNVNPAGVHQGETNEVSSTESASVGSAPETVSVSVDETSSSAPVEISETVTEEEPADIVEVTEEVTEDKTNSAPVPVAFSEVEIEESPEEIINLNEDTTVPEETQTQPEDTNVLAEPDKAFVNEVSSDEVAGIPRSFEMGPSPDLQVVLESEPQAEPKQVTLAPGETTKVTVQAPVAVKQPTRAVIQRPQPSVIKQQLRPHAQVQEKPAPAPVQEKPTPVQAASQPQSTQEQREYVYHRCHNLQSGEDCHPLTWRSSPNYIPELEDYEIPEDWWRNGYAPFEGENKADEETRYHREHCKIPPPPKNVFVEPPPTPKIERPVVVETPVVVEVPVVVEWEPLVETRPVVLRGPEQPVEQIIVEKPVPVYVETPVPVYIDTPVVHNHTEDEKCTCEVPPPPPPVACALPAPPKPKPQPIVVQRPAPVRKQEECLTGEHKRPVGATVVGSRLSGNNTGRVVQAPRVHSGAVPITAAPTRVAQTVAPRLSTVSPGTRPAVVESAKKVTTAAPKPATTTKTATTSTQKVTATPVKATTQATKPAIQKFPSYSARST